MRLCLLHVIHTGPSPVVSTEASPASPPSSFYPSCFYCPSVSFIPSFPRHLQITPASRRRFLFLYLFSPRSERVLWACCFNRRAASAGREKHPSTTTRRQGANTATPILTPTVPPRGPRRSFPLSMSAFLKPQRAFLGCSLTCLFSIPQISTGAGEPLCMQRT